MTQTAKTAGTSAWVIRAGLVDGWEANIYLMTHSTHFIYGCLVKDDSDNERENLPLHRLLFLISRSGQVRVFNVHI